MPPLRNYLKPATNAEIQGAIRTVVPTWVKGSTISIDEAAHASGVLLSGKLADAISDSESDAALVAQAHGFIASAVVAPATSVAFVDVAEIKTWRANAIHAHAVALAADMAKNYAKLDAVIGVIAGGASLYLTGNPAGALLAIEPLIAAFQAYSGGNDAAFDDLGAAA